MISRLYELVFHKRLSELAERDPSFSTTAFGHRLHFFLPDTNFQIQAIAIQIFHIAVSSVICIIIYTMIVREWRDRPRTGPSRHSPSAQGLLVTFGVIIPLVFYIPVFVIQHWDVQIRAFRMLLIALPFTVSLSCLEALFGLTPEPATKSWKEYLLSVAFVLRPVYRNGAHVRTTWTSIIKSLLGHVWYAHLCNILLVLLRTVDYEPFKTTKSSNDPSLIMSLDVGQWYNTFLQALAINMTLLFGFMGICGIMKLLTGREYDDRGSHWPMFCARSPGDFWRRWNIVVHHGLKNGVYKPVRWLTTTHHEANNISDPKKKPRSKPDENSLQGGGSPMIAALATFFASGLYHEFVWYFIFLDSKPDIETGCVSCYRPTPWIGKQMIFFCWNGLLVLLEYSFIGKRLSVVGKYLPNWLVCHLVVMTALPFGHLFTGDTVHSNYFDGILLGMVDMKVERIKE